MTWTQHKPSSLIIGVIDSVPSAASLIDRLLDARLQPGALSLLSSERTADQHLAPASVSRSPEAGATPGLGLRRIAANLSPLAPLGAPASGLVATGLLRAALVTSGIGSGRGFAHALMGLGIEPATAAEIARRINQGAVLVGARIDNLDPHAQRVTGLLEGATALAVRLQVAQAPNGTRVVAARTLASNPRAP